MVPVMVTFLWTFKEAVETIFSHVFCQDSEGFFFCKCIDLGNF